jgi:hypothetical protein
MALEEPPSVKTPAVSHTHVETPVGSKRQGFSYVVLVCKFILPRSLGENPIFPNKPINSDTSPDFSSSVHNGPSTLQLSQPRTYRRLSARSHEISFLATLPSPVAAVSVVVRAVQS